METTDKGLSSFLKRLLRPFLPLRVTRTVSSGLKSRDTRIPYLTMKDGHTSKQPKTSSWTSLATSSKRSQTFHLFTSLPIELRLQIWKLALFNTPRVVEFIEVLNIDSPARHNPTAPRVFDHLLLSTPIPLVLQICRETRSFALSRYIFSTGNVRLYLDPNIDTLYFGKLSSYSTLQIFALCALEADLRRLERLVINEDFLAVLRRPVRTASGTVSPAFKVLSGLSDLILLLPSTAAHRRSTLGWLCYDQHCSVCRKMEKWKGSDGWAFPTYKQYVSGERKGVEDETSELGYRVLLEMVWDRRTDWFAVYVKRTMWHGCRVVVDDGTSNIKACSIASLHRFIDVKVR